MTGQRTSTYKPFNMNGARYYTYARENVRFFVLDTTQMDAKQVSWIDAALQDAKEDWKICYFHHPLYSTRLVMVPRSTYA